MKYRIIKVALLLFVAFHLASCFRHIHTDNKRPDRYHYRKGGRYW